MKVVRTDLPDVVLVEPAVFGDSRGWFMESFNEARFHAELSQLGLPAPRPFVQDNHSCSESNVLRGLHYQLAPHAQGKLVRVVRGKAFDVAVDLRRQSPTFGKWVGAELSESNRRQMWIPEGFAHGFVALESNTHFLYKTTDYYDRSCERAIVWNDPDIGIAWPSDLQISDLLLAAKDAQAPSLAKALARDDVF